jgi:hypothetical protein
MCSGCIHYIDAPASSKLRGDRDVTHTSDKFQCDKPWIKGNKDYYGTCRYEDIQEFLETQQGITATVLERNRGVMGLFSPASAVVNMEEEEGDLSPLTNPNTESTSSGEEGSDGRKRKKEKDEVLLESATINSQGHAFVVEGIPRTHVVLHKSYLLKLQNLEQQVKDLTHGFSNYRFNAKSSSHYMRTLLAVTLSSCPALPLSQAATVLPLFSAAFLVDAGFMKKTDVVKFSKSFPSESMLRDLLFTLAAENSIALGEYLKNKVVFLSCDKGNKKGIGHFVKILSWWDVAEERVRKQCLDIDAAEGTSALCATAICASLKKVGNLKLQGQTTDSGGGGVLDGLAKKLDESFVCRPNYLIASCSLHCLQLAFANPVKSTMGDGGLGSKTVMQLIHSVHDLQASIETTVWKTHCEAAVAFLNANVDTAYVGVTDADKSFAEKWEMIKTFRQFTPIDEVTMKKTVYKIPAPVMTRWWTVGETAAVVWSSYLLLFRLCQQVINSLGTIHRANKVASNLQPLLLEAELYSDLCMIHNYHSFFVGPHFAWMEGTDDLSELPGFQSHNMLPRYFAMEQDLQSLKATVLSTHVGFEATRLSLLNLSEAASIQQRKKIATFVDIAIEAIEKHFIRWCNKSLLPASLLSEYELASVVASVMTNKPLNTALPTEYYSQVHKYTFDRNKYYDFIVFRLAIVVHQDDTQQYEAFTVRTADLLLGGSEFRDKQQQDPVKYFMYAAYLPLASHTQFVEAGVKEAKIISCTDRSEQLRSAYAVNRSATMHNEKVRTMTVTQRIQWLLKATRIHVDRHEELGQELPEYSKDVAKIAGLMRQHHFKEERLQKLQDDALKKLNKNKKENALQKATGVDTTNAMAGLFAYGNLVSKLHLDAIGTELLFRGCSEEAIAKLKIRERIKMLKDLELKRVVDNGGDDAQKAAALKAFEPLSEAVFPAK